MPSNTRLTLLVAAALLATPVRSSAADPTPSEKAALEERQRALKGMGDPAPAHPVLNGLPDLPGTAPDAAPATKGKAKDTTGRKHKRKQTP